MHSETVSKNLPDVTHWYTDHYEIYHKDVDFNNELRLSALLLMLQESAWNHARAIGIDYRQEAFKSIIWVLSRLRVEMLGDTPLWMEQVNLATSPTGIDRLFALRDFMAMHRDGRPFARVASAWIMIDATTRRPVRPQSLLDENNFHFEPTVMPVGTCKLSEPSDLEWGSPFRPGYTDIDAHQHVNNVSYAQWCVNVLQPEFFQMHRLASFDINFLSEVSWGQAVAVGCAKNQIPVTAASAETAIRPDFYQDFVIRKAEDAENAAVVRMAWQRR